MAETLVDMLKNPNVKLNKALVKVPKLKVRKAKVVKPKKEDNLPASSIVNILIKAAVEKAKRERKEKAVEEKSYSTIKDERAVIFNGGYGTVSKGYSSAPRKAYIDYRKLFSYLGKFKSQGSFENFVSESPTERMNKILEQDNKFYFVDREVIDDGIRGMKYFTHGLHMGAPSAVPMGNTNSADWEKFKLWMIVEYVLFKLKMDTL